MDDSKLRAVRNEALEDAALIAEATKFEGQYCTTEDCSAAAVAIRALKDRPSLIPTAPRAWVKLADSEWANIVNHDYEAYSKNEAVFRAVKMTEAKLKELNTAPIPAADHQETGISAKDHWEQMTGRADARAAMEQEEMSMLRREIHNLKRHIEDYCRPVTEQDKDTERLNFVAAHPEMFLRHSKKRWSFIGMTNYEYEVFNTPREAIDAVILATKEGGAA